MTLIIREQVISTNQPREANLSLSSAHTIFRIGTFRGQSISFSWLCRHPGARSLKLDVWGKGKWIPPSLPWMQAAFILRKAINARMCLSHSHNPPWPPLKFFSSGPPLLLQTSRSLPVLPTMTHCYHPLHCCDHCLLYQDKPPTADSKCQGKTKLVTSFGFKYFTWGYVSYKTVSTIYL